jgi:hypothetical protein
MRSAMGALAALALMMSLGMPGAEAAIGNGMNRLAGKWGGCIEGEAGFLTFTRQGRVTVTNDNDEDAFTVYADVFERTRPTRFFPEDLVILMPEVDSDGEIDASEVVPLLISFLGRDLITIRPDLDYEMYVLKRMGTPSGLACKGERNVARLLESLRKKRRR